MIYFKSIGVADADHAGEGFAGGFEVGAAGQRGEIVGGQCATEGQHIVAGQEGAAERAVDVVVDREFGEEAQVDAVRFGFALDGEAQESAESEVGLPVLYDVEAQAVGAGEAQQRAADVVGLSEGGAVVDERSRETVLLDAEGEIVTTIEPVANFGEPSIGEVECQAGLDGLMVEGVVLGAVVVGRELVVEIHGGADIEREGLLGGEYHESLCRGGSAHEEHNTHNYSVLKGAERMNHSVAIK